MSIKTVLLIWVNPLFLDSIQLLLKNPEVNCVGITFDVDSTKNEIQKLRPDVVIFEKTETGIPLDIMEIFEVIKWKIRVLELSLSDNELNVYQHQHLTVGKAEDLLNIILN